LAVGDPAPPLAIAQWVMGDRFDGFEAGQLYVVEFWATWCGPCRTSMPHLSELSTQLGDKVKIVGVTREDVETVEAFLEGEQSEGTKWRNVVTYRLATDQDGTTSDAYMKAAEQSGIPTAFIVGRDGVVEWIGHPMAMDEPLASIVEDTYDRSAAIVEFQKRQQIRKLSRQLTDLVRAGDYEGALELMDDIAEEFGEQSGLLLTKLTLLHKAGHHEEAAALRQQLVEQLWDNPMGLNHIAWEVSTGGEPRDLDLALRAATQASELTRHENASILDTVARVYYEQGNLQDAIAWQEKAVEHGGKVPVFQETLEKYKAEQVDDAGELAVPDDAASEPGDASDGASDN
jgi:thiol-disulfide isomerase/thioredoxin